MGISRIIYNLSVLPFPTPGLMKDLERLLYNYVWGGVGKMKWFTIIGPYKKGGSKWWTFGKSQKQSILGGLQG